MLYNYAFRGIFVASFVVGIFAAGGYEPNWTSLDSRPLPTWFDEAKVGIFLHWGVFSVPSYCHKCAAEWFWAYWKAGNPALTYFMNQNYRPDFTYADFASQFTAEFYNASQWAQLFEKSGAKYVVLTSKHHEGFTNWPSANSFNWNSMDIGPHRDLVGELADAIRNTTSLHFGLYHSLYEWFNPLYESDKKSGFTEQNFVKSKTLPELYDIVNKYKPDVIWSDGQWEASSSYWNSTEFIAWLYNESPVKDTVVTNDRWGKNTLCKHGGYLTCKDRFNPGTLQKRKFENAFTVDKSSWGYRRNAQIEDYMSINEILKDLVITVSCGGNILLNVGPTKEGIIAPLYEERLTQMGEWLTVNGEAVYSSTPWKHQNDTEAKNIWYTTRNSKVYAFVLTLPASGIITMKKPLPDSETASIKLLGHDGNVSWEYLKNDGLFVFLPSLNPSTPSVSCKWVYVFELIGFS